MESTSHPSTQREYTDPQWGSLHSGPDTEVQRSGKSRGSRLREVMGLRRAGGVEPPSPAPTGKKKKFIL